MSPNDSSTGDTYRGRPINDGPPCPECGENDWKRTPEADSKIVCTQCNYAADEVFPPRIQREVDAETEPDDSFLTDGGTQSCDTERKLPSPPRERNVPPRNGIPSTGFATPHQRDRFDLVESLTDRHTAIHLYAMVYEGGYTNFETALKSAINGLSSRHEDHGTRWRYYCPECEFIGVVSSTFTEADLGSCIHDDAVDGCDSVVFAYHSEDWDPDSVEALVERYLRVATDQEDQL